MRFYEIPLTFLATRLQVFSWYLYYMWLFLSKDANIPYFPCIPEWLLKILVTNPIWFPFWDVVRLGYGVILIQLSNRPFSLDDLVFPIRIMWRYLGDLNLSFIFIKRLHASTKMSTFRRKINTLLGIVTWSVFGKTKSTSEKDLFVFKIYRTCKTSKEIDKIQFDIKHGEYCCPRRVLAQRPKPEEAP